MIEAIFFDVGGVFRDSRLAMHEGLAQAFAAKGLPFNFSPDDVWHLRGIHVLNPRKAFVEFALNFEGVPSEVLSLSYAEAVELCSRYVGNPSPLVEELATKSEELFYAADKVVQLFERERKDVLNKLKQRVKLGIITNSRKESLHRDVPDLLPVMDVLVGKEDVRNKKPDPEPLLKAASLAGVEPSSSIYIADSVHDLFAARAAGMRFIGVATGMSLPNWLEENGAPVASDVLSALEVISRSL